MRRLRLTPAMGISLVALVLAAAGGAYAATASQTITACVRHQGGTLYIGKCQEHDHKVSWNQRGQRGLPGPKGNVGPTGPQGPAGPQGPTGAAGSARGWAVVGPTGAVSTQGGAVTIKVIHYGTGKYCLQFSPDPGYYSPIIATLHGESTIGFISVDDEYGNDCNPYGGVEVLTEDSAGTSTDEWFAVGVL